MCGTWCAHPLGAKLTYSYFHFKVKLSVFKQFVLLSLQIMIVSYLSIIDIILGHGAMTFPKPRNAIDGSLPEFKAWHYPCDATHKGVNCTMTFCGEGKTCSFHWFCCTVLAQSRNFATPAHLDLTMFIVKGIKSV